MDLLKYSLALTDYWTYVVIFPRLCVQKQSIYFEPSLCYFYYDVAFYNIIKFCSIHKHPSNRLEIQKIIIV